MRALTPPNSARRIWVSLCEEEKERKWWLDHDRQIRTLEKHQSNTNMGTLPTPFAETVQIAPDMKHSTAAVTSILALWVSHNAQFFAVSNFGANLNPLSDDALVSRVDTAQLAERLECFFISASASEPTR